MYGFLQQLCSHLNKPKLVAQICCLSTSINEYDIKKTVYISQSRDIYTNLALEDWLYKKYDFSKHHILMLWQSNPCVVIGRHQNPWLEANVSNLNEITGQGVQLARRNSGGGTVYHDEGNLNLTFFTSRACYDRKYNLEIISRALMKEYGLKVDVSSRDDLTCRDLKVSGTAAKLSRTTAYHHCTLLVDVNKSNLSKALQKRDMGIKTNATISTRSNILNLCDENQNICVRHLMNVIGLEYMRRPARSITDGVMKLVNEQNGFQMINPSDEWFPGLMQIRSDLQSWEWCYGKTPKFTISKSFTIPDNLLDNFRASNCDLQVTITVENGRIDKVDLNTQDLSLYGLDDATKVIENLKGCRFSEETFINLDTIEVLLNEKNRFVTSCIKNVMNVI